MWTPPPATTAAAVIRKGSKNAPAKKKEAKDLASVLERELAYEKEVRAEPQ